MKERKKGSKTIKTHKCDGDSSLLARRPKDMLEMKEARMYISHRQTRMTPYINTLINQRYSITSPPWKKASGQSETLMKRERGGKKKKKFSLRKCLYDRRGVQGNVEIFRRSCLARLDDSPGRSHPSIPTPSLRYLLRSSCTTHATSPPSEPPA